MSDQRPSLSRLEARKQLLVAEAELQREQLRGDLDILEDGARTLAARVQSWAVAGALAIAGLSAFKQTRHGSSASSAGQQHSSWFSKLWSGARIATVLWRTLRGQGR